MTKQLFMVGLFLLALSCNEAEKNTANTKQEPESLEALSQRIEQFGGNAEDYFQRAKLLFERGELESASQDAVRAIDLDSTSTVYYHLLSDIQLNGLQSRDALRTLEYIANKHPTDRLSLLKLMETQLLLRQYMPALGTSQRLLRLDPQDEEAFFLRGLLFKEQNEDSLAIVNFQRAVDINPTMTGAFVVLGDLHEKKSDPLAEGYYENAVRSDSNDINALYALAFYQQNHEKETEAIATYDRITERDSTFQPAFVNKGILLLKNNNPDQARYTLEQGLKIDSSFTINLYYLAMVYHELGQMEEGRKLLNKALEIDPDYTVAKQALNELFN